ncbi:MAG: tetratricopeptide repeat protein [Saprospiraceae bacterium]|nr:tetratricopeptide repeat protein [Saprospiraceae bacterium]
MKTRYTLLFTLFFAAGLHAQVRLDSVLLIWKNTSLPDTVRIKALQYVTWRTMNTIPDSSYKLALEQLAFARDKKMQKWEGKAYYNMASNHYWQGEYAEAFRLFQKSLDIRSALDDKQGVAAILGNFGLLYNEQGNNVKAVEYLHRSLKINESIRDTAGMCANYSNLASIYLELKNSAKALEFYNLSLSLYDPVVEQRDIAITLNNIANVYKAEKDYDKALEYLNNSLEIRLKYNDRTGMAINYINLGSLYLTLGDYEKAVLFVEKSIELFLELDDKSGLTAAYHNMGEIASRQNRPRDAERWCSKSLKLAREIDKVPIQSDACNCLYKAYKSMGNAAKALEYYEQYTVLNDSLQNNETEVKLNQLEFEKAILTDSLTREEEKRDLRLAYQDTINRKNRTLTASLIAAGVILLLASLFLVGMMYFRRRSAVLQLKTQQLENQQLLNEIALLKSQVNPHFLFNSLSILSSLVRHDPELSEQFIDQLSRSYRYILEQKEQTLVPLRTELEFIKSYAFLLKIRFDKKFDLQFDVSEEALDRLSIAPLTIQLLVENAVKHNRMSAKEPLTVRVHIDEQQNLVVTNKLQPRSTPATSTGMGLQNIINRYALLTDKPVWAGEREEAFEVRVPLLAGSGQQAVGSRQRAAGSGQ